MTFPAVTQTWKVGLRSHEVSDHCCQSVVSAKDALPQAAKAQPLSIHLPTEHRSLVQAAHTHSHSRIPATDETPRVLCKGCSFPKGQVATLYKGRQRPCGTCRTSVSLCSWPYHFSMKYVLLS